MKGLSVVLLSLFLAAGCKHLGYNQGVITDYSLEESDPIIEKDSIDYIIDDRAKIEFNSSIFAGIHFGDSEQTVKQKMGIGEYRTILIPKGDKVEKITIHEYFADYYKNHLASLTLYGEPDELIDELGLVYSTKYGKTKNNKWTYSNCEIEIRYGYRSVYHTTREGRTQYYCSYTGCSTTAITGDATFLKIIYKDYSLIQKIEQQRHEEDSLRKVQELKEAEAEKILAKKLREGTASNI